MPHSLFESLVIFSFRELFIALFLSRLPYCSTLLCVGFFGICSWGLCLLSEETSTLIVDGKGPGFEAGGSNVPSNISPWTIIGDDSNILVSTDRSSCFERNKTANIEKAHKYGVIFYVKAQGARDLHISIVGSENGGRLRIAPMLPAHSYAQRRCAWRRRTPSIDAYGVGGRPT
ncbi:hypothetical protein Fmac_005821 [Flemingia macrophylla]|uniref:DUF642 domain-containing protein n=1 Tax=Flemingia macrophylla TaxID=520843 RepID=A0ABD1N9D0_9FABA